MGIEEQVEIRQRLIDEIEADLIGPRKGATKEERAVEVLPGNRNPKNEYVAGVLFPGNWEVSDEDKEQESGGDTDDEDNTDSNVMSDKLFKPSSFGLTCRLSPETKEITATIEYGIYSALKNNETKFTTFHRTPQTESFQIIMEKNTDEVKFKNNPNFQINYTVIKENDQIILDFYVMNNAEKKEINYWFDFMFQPKIFLESMNDEKCFIQDRTGLTQEYFPASDAHLEILFKDKISFGKGHLCSLTWDKENIENRCINKINTTFIPQETSDFIDHTPPTTELESVIDMTALGTCTDKTKLRGMLEPLIIKYKKWADDISSEIDSSAGYTSEELGIIKTQIKNTDLVLERMRQGIDLLESDEKAFDSFTFANMTIAWQQVHGKWAANNAEKGEIEGSDPLEPIYDDGKKPKWRLFQIAFILMNLESIVNPQSKFRETVDLLWFPTGGGKTEAYLGLVAFILSYRRLRGADTDGVLTNESFGTSVIMRYTLRLLTVQQFQRAATLMCACEKLRLDKKFTFMCPDCNGKTVSSKNEPCITCNAKGVVRKWGNVPFQVGLWVGASVTPNNRKEAKSVFWKLKQSRDQDLSTITDKNPYILINCPWCGTKLKYTDGKVDGKPEQWRLWCSRNSCIFSKHLDVDEDLSLPVVLVDEDIYSRVPALIIATVDKFAQISWNPKVKAVFGKVNTFCDFHGYYDRSLAKHAESHTIAKGKKPEEYISNNIELLPPDMIIQDELHLISGPLGTLSGLYETAIEFLCTNNGIKPKIIASTATTRAASDQIQKLFNRDDTMIFPPQIKTFGETFFSTVDTTKAGKTYLGVLATGKSGLTVLAKVSAIILRRIRQFEEDEEYTKKELDPYFTLVTYFNSQRELGGASMNFKDSVPDFIKQIHNNFDDSPLLPSSVTSSTEISIEESEKEEEPKSKEEEEKITKSFETKWSDALRPYQFKDLVTDELTSRKKSGEIPETLRKLSDSIVKIPVNENKYSDNQPVDLLMATNMLSVGVDIPRLGAMIVNGQPKNNSEYIQATGRIGRSSPGLIVTLYSYTKPRDLSYYENFKDYHSNYYKNVETVGLTPFTLRARKIGLFGIIVGMIRMAIGGNYSLSENDDAKNFDQKNPDQIKIINKIKDAIQTRVDSIEPEESASTVTNIINLLNQWTKDIERHGEILLYREPFHPDMSQKKLEQNMYLLKSDPTSKRQLISTPTSLRNAEQEQNFFYVDSDEDEDDE